MLTSDRTFHVILPDLIVFRFFYRRRLCSSCFFEKAVPFSTLRPAPFVRLRQQHFHTSNHSSDHPQKAFIMNQRALDEQLPAFEEVGGDELLVCCDKLVPITPAAVALNFDGNLEEGVNLNRYANTCSCQPTATERVGGV